MDNNDRNQYQIIRKDAKDCFVEAKSDSFPIGKVHLEFVAYDKSRPTGHRYTSHIHIYLDFAEFLGLAHFILYGDCHSRMAAAKKAGGDALKTPLFKNQGGTSATRLRQSGRERRDGMSEARCLSLFVGNKDYLLCAESGPGQTNATGLIVAKYEGRPEQRVTVSLDYVNLNELMLVTQAHFTAWLTAWYAKYYKSPNRSYGNADGNSRGMENGNDFADDTQMF